MDKLFETSLRVVDWSYWLVRVAVNKLLPPLSSLESKIFNEIQAHIKNEYLAIFEEQVNSFNVVRRLGTGDVEIYFLHWSLWFLKFGYRGDRRFNSNKPKEKLSIFSLELEDKTLINCSLIAINGVISHINMRLHDTRYNEIKNNLKVNVKIKHGLITKT